MPKKTEFHSIEFFRKIRDRQAAALAGKSPAEIIAFFNQASLPKKRYSDTVPQKPA